MLTPWTFHPSLRMRDWIGRAVRVRADTLLFARDLPMREGRRTFRAGDVLVCAAAEGGSGHPAAIGCCPLDEPGLWWFGRDQLDYGRIVGMGDATLRVIERLALIARIAARGRLPESATETDHAAELGERHARWWEAESDFTAPPKLDEPPAGPAPIHPFPGKRP